MGKNFNTEKIFKTVKVVHVWMSEESPNEKILNYLARTTYVIFSILIATEIKPLYIEIVSLYTSGQIIYASLVITLAFIVLGAAFYFLRYTYEQLRGKDIKFSARYKFVTSLLAVLFFPLLKKILVVIGKRFKNNHGQ